MDNIEVFNTIVGFVFADLYESFPIPRDLDPTRYTEWANLSGDSEDMDGEEADPVSHAIDWLVDEGFIRSSSAARYGVGTVFYQCVLTHRGLQLLSLPESLTNQTSLGTQITTAAKSGAIDGVRGLAKTVICEGSKLAFQFGIDAMLRRLP